MVRVVRALVDTVIKFRPVPSGELDSAERFNFGAGMELPVVAVGRALERGHYLVTLGKDGTGQISFGGRNTIYVWSGHVSIEERDQVVNGQMVVSDAGVALIKHFEGLKLDAYPDPGTGGDPWTIGFGTTGPEVKPGMRISEAQAEEFLRIDLASFGIAVSELVKVPLRQHQFDALVSFSYNVGAGALGSSTLLRKINGGDFRGASMEFLRWCYAGGQVMEGLRRRRLAEQKMFEGQPWR